METKLAEHRLKILETESQLRHAKGKKHKRDLFKHLIRLKRELVECEYYLYGINPYDKRELEKQNN